jgi:hypothetical protein
VDVIRGVEILFTTRTFSVDLLLVTVVLAFDFACMAGFDFSRTAFFDFACAFEFTFFFTAINTLSFDLTFLQQRLRHFI